MKRLALLLILQFIALNAVGQITVQSPLSDDRDVHAGSSYAGTVVVLNETDQQQQVKIYQTDYLFSADGSNQFAEPGSAPRSNADWVELGPRLVTLAPRAATTIGYSVRVPNALPEPGSYWSMLMVEAIPRESAESTLGLAREPQLGVMQVTRYGIQIASHVSGGTPGIAFQEVSLEPVPDGQSLWIDLGNNGTRLARAAVTIELFSSDGDGLGRRVGDPVRIYPGTSVRQRVDLSDVPPGTYEALILVDSGGENLTGAQYTLEL